ncbi:MAG: hypothetical protein ACRDCT_01635 [Shewanella sp.]
MQFINQAMEVAGRNGISLENSLAGTVADHNVAKHRTTNVALKVLLFGRHRRGKIPHLNDGRVEVNEDELRERDAAQKEATKSHEDSRRRAKAPSVSRDDEVYVKRHRRKKVSPDLVKKSSTSSEEQQPREQRRLEAPAYFSDYVLKVQQ